MRLKMRRKNKFEERFYEILERKGGTITDETRKILTEEIGLKELQAPLQFLSENWRDVLRPALMALSCEAVGGQPEKTSPAAKAMTLMNLSLMIWDDIIDNTKFRYFKPTLYGKFGQGPALIIGGLITAKAFSILGEMEEKEIPSTACRRIRKLFLEFWLKIADAESTNLKLRRRREDVRAQDKFHVFEMRSFSIEACMKIGAILGGGSDTEVKHLARYGSYLGTIFELSHDLVEALNLTLQLADRIKGRSLPYISIYAKNSSDKVQNFLSLLSEKNKIGPIDIKKVVESYFETESTDHIVQIVRDLTKKAVEKLLKLRDGEARRLLEDLVQAQLPLFLKNLGVT